MNIVPISRDKNMKNAASYAEKCNGRRKKSRRRNESESFLRG